MIPEISGAIAAINGLKTAVSNFVDLHDATKLKAFQLEVLNQTIDVKSSIIELQETISADRDLLRDARAEIVELEAQLAARAHYRLMSTPGTRHMAYHAPANPETGEPEHWLCQPCYDAGRKSVMHIRKGAGGTGYACPGNPAHYLSD